MSDEAIALVTVAAGVLLLDAVLYARSKIKRGNPTHPILIFVFLALVAVIIWMTR